MNKAVVCLISFLFFSICANSSDVLPEPSTHETKIQSFEFALIGDVPYGIAVGKKSKAFERLVNDINQQTQLKWVLFAGDMKSGGSTCSNAMYKDRFKRFSQFEKPFILTFGDNEWTDCHRVTAGQFQPLERLSKLRKVFFPVPGTTLGKHPMKVVTQATVPGFKEFPENVRWIENNVLFTVMHIVGSNNALEDFDGASSAKRTEADDAEVKRRTHAAIAWMEDSFALAKNKNVAGVFVMIHANPGLDFIIFKRDGFTDFVNALDKHTRDFVKPVVLAHGDTHQFRVDHTSLNGESAPANFTRVETFGKTEDYWIRVKVDPEDSKVFSFVQEKVKKNIK